MKKKILVLLGVILILVLGSASTVYAECGVCAGAGSTSAKHRDCTGTKQVTKTRDGCTVTTETRCCCSYTALISKTTSTSHDYEWEDNSSKHWKECTRCGATTSEGSHKWSDVGTASTCQKCSTCGRKDTSHSSSASYDSTSHWTECSTCGYNDSEPHSLSYSYDSSGHWQKCSGCGYTSSTSSHSMSSVGTSGTCRQCSTCGYTTSSHSMSYTYNSSGHWQECSYCSYSTSSESHSMSTVGTSGTCRRCSTCGYTLSHSMSYSYNSSSHWRECYYCSYSTSSSSHSYTLVSTSGTCRKCTTCGYYDYSHSWGAWKSNDSGHWRICSDCSYNTGVSAHTDANDDALCDTCNYVLITYIDIPTVTNYVYDGKSHRGVSDGDGYTLSGTLSATNVGTYTVTVKLWEKYAWKDKSTNDQKLTWKITRAPIEVPAGEVLIYNGSVQIGLKAGTGYTVGGVLEAINVGTYVATATVDSNHKWSDGSTGTKNVTWYINRKPIALPAVNDITWNGTEQLGVNDGEGYTLSGTLWATDAGIYIAYATLDANHCWTGGSIDVATIEWELKRAEIAIPTGANTMYNGGEQIGFTSGTYYSAGGTTSATNAGTHIATATPDSNHRWPDGTIETKEIPWVISPKEVTVRWGDNTVFDYNGTEQGPTVEGESGITGEIITVIRTLEVDAGTHTSTASISRVDGGMGRKENYVIVNPTIQFVINKISSVLTVNPDNFKLVAGSNKISSYVYNGDGTVTASSSDDNVAIASVDEEKNEVTITGVSKATAIITVNAAEGKNYLAASAEIEVEVFAKPTAIFTEVSTSNAKWSGWELSSGASVNASGVLSLNNGGTAEKMFVVDGKEWVLGVNALGATATANGMRYTVTYYDSNFNVLGTASDSDNLTTSYVYNTWSGLESFDDSKVRYVKVAIESNGTAASISEVTFNSGVDENYSGIKIDSSADLGEIASIKYLWTKSESGITESDITNEIANGNVVYPKYGAKGEYYLWVLLEDTAGGKNILRSDVVIIDNLEIEVSVTSKNWLQEIEVKAYVFNKESTYNNEDVTSDTRGANVSDAYVSGPKANITNITSRFNGSKAWNLEKTGTNAQWHGLSSEWNNLNGLGTNSYVLVSSNYRTSDAAGISRFEVGAITSLDGNKTYTTNIVDKEVDIFEDGKEHHTYYLLQTSEAISSAAALTSGMPNWNYSSEAGSMDIDGIQWFTFSNLTTDLNDGVALKKYAEGEQTIEYFKNNGTSFTGNSFNVTKNGIYTIYGKTTNGVERVRTIEIKNADTTAPNVSVDLSGYIEGTTTGDTVSAIVKGTETQSGVDKIEYSLNNSTWTSILPTNNNNLLPNSDFENLTVVTEGWNIMQNGNYVPTDWSCYNSNVENPNTGFHVHVNSTKFNSNVLAFVNENSEVGMEGRKLSAIVNIDGGLKASTNYTLSFDVYAEDEGVKLTGGAFYSLTSGAIDFHSGQMDIDSANNEVGHWVRKTYTFTTSASTNTARSAALHIYGNLGEEGTVYLKNVKLEEGNATAWTPLESEQTVLIKKGYKRFENTMDSTVYFKVTDVAGNYTVVEKIIRIDKDIPVITGLKINGGASITKDIDVALEVICDDAVKMYVSNEKVAPLREDYVPYTKYYKQRLVTGNGNKDVYVWCKDACDNVTAVKVASIELKATYTLQLINKQEHFGREGMTVYYSIKADEGNWEEWQTSDKFIELEPFIIYHAKTKVVDDILDSNGNEIYEESDEIIFEVLYDENGEMYIDMK